MSTKELAHLFPSGTHPGLPVAAKILSTLRYLTSPGLGNDLKAEERPALVGVAAILACERVQSHDLAIAAVQRASSVSPARFKSALTLGRRLMAAADALSPSSGRSGASSPIWSPSTPRKARTGPLTTPHKHSPATPSALRHDTTPRRDETTPTKSTLKRKAVDLVEDEEEGPKTPTKRAAKTARELEFQPPPEPLADPEAMLERAQKTSLGPRARKPRRDWSYRESVWGAPRGREEIDKVWAALGGKYRSAKVKRGETAESVILSVWT